MAWSLHHSSKRSQDPTARSRQSILHWNDDIAIIFDPVRQKFLRGSVSKIEATKREKPFYMIELPAMAKHLECYVPMGGRPEQRIFLGRIHLSRLGTHINFHRMRGQKMSLYIFGQLQVLD